jgi:hypothetical protein
MDEALIGELFIKKTKLRRKESLELRSLKYL